MVLLMLHVVPEHEAAAWIDFETIMLLLGMMSIVAVLRESGLFSIISVKIASLTKGSPVKILIVFSIVTAVLSAFLDNVTTVLIIISIIIELAREMGLDPKIYVISLAIAILLFVTQTITSDHRRVAPTGKAGTVSLCTLCFDWVDNCPASALKRIGQPMEISRYEYNRGNLSHHLGCFFAIWNLPYCKMT